MNDPFTVGMLKTFIKDLPDDMPVVAYNGCEELDLTFPIVETIEDDPCNDDALSRFIGKDALRF